MVVRLSTFLAILILLYGLSIPIFAGFFFDNNGLTSLYVILCCFIISFLLYSRKAIAINLVVSFYIFKQYLTRPYVDIFHDKLDASQLKYIIENDSYYSSAGAEVVYLNLLSLLIVWTIGLFLIKNNKPINFYCPKIFKLNDDALRSFDWRLILIFIFIYSLSFISPEQISKSSFGYESSPLFAYGLFNIDFLAYCLLAQYVYLKHINSTNVSFILLLPIFYSAGMGIITGGRGGLYQVIIFVLLYWIFLNFKKNTTYKDIKRFFFLFLSIPFVIFSGLIAQSSKSFLRLKSQGTSSSDNSLFESIIQDLNIFNPENPIVKTLYFGVTELFHRLSHLQAQFLILNDQYKNLPSETWNLAHMSMRTINDLVPGLMFKDVIGINQLFHHIYFNENVHYSSHSWGIQGSIYLWFGFIGGAIFVFFLALVISRYYKFLLGSLINSPTFFVFTLLFLLDLLEMGVLERVIVVDIVRPLFSIVMFIFISKILNFNFHKIKFK